LKCINDGGSTWITFPIYLFIYFGYFSFISIFLLFKNNFFFFSPHILKMQGYCTRFLG
jgi:hypothetical protein